MKSRPASILIPLIAGLLLASGALRSQASPPAANSELALDPGPPPAADLAGKALEAGPGIKLNWVPEGTFKMGIAAYHHMATVHLTRGFWLGRTEVTQGQWQALMGNNPSTYQKGGAEVPVDRITWNEAMDYCRRLNQQEKAKGRVPDGYDYRLPTDAEWEYACRSGTKSIGEVGGDGVLSDMAWDSNNSGGHPHPVATKQANDWGFYDMQGNVSELCYDWLGAAIHGEVTDPAGPAFGTFRVMRGGNYNAITHYMDLSHRLWQNPGLSRTGLGFRVALAPHITAPPPPANQWVQVPPGPRPPADIAGRKLTAGEAGIELLWIPAGRFAMEEHRPIHVKVRITRGFWLGRTEVTQAQWQALMGDNPSHFKNEGPDAPVDTISWNDAMEFCRRINRKEQAAGRLPPGYEYRLPTEAEWEYACRAGTTGEYAGDGKIGDMAWYGENSGGHTHPVAEKMPNAWGLYDMHGNVWEPVYDIFGIYPPNGEATDPAGVWAGTLRVSRGGAWLSVDGTLDSGHRTGNAEDFSSNLTGLRLALAPAINP